jgi:hypothetical protein
MWFALRRAAVDGRFDEIAETFLSMEDHIEELRNDLDENSVELKLQMEKVGKKAKAGIFGSMFMSRMSFKSRPGEGGGGTATAPFARFLSPPLCHSIQ